VRRDSYFCRAAGITEQDAGHAWAEALVPDLAWVAFDPTNGISAADQHLGVAVALDYLSAAPVRGAQTGGSGGGRFPCASWWTRR
jgi:transglutaminase-like putative cysteine protease